ncbi:NAD-dependent epimerase/dehydratase family protein [Candidatus Bathyarchaeota archaeon]|nr:NAD-dependent epimerase/dehydratase family protein [Candidatus Bathyarchaeota archaeon]
MNSLAKDNSSVIFGNSGQTRDFVYVHDVAEAFLLALKREGIAGEIFNIRTGLAATINQLADAKLKVANKTCLKIAHSKPRKGDIKHSIADISKTKGN